MVYELINRNILVPQTCDDERKYRLLEIDKTYVVEPYLRGKNKRTIPPLPKDDVRLHLLNEAKAGDVVITSTLANLSTNLIEMLDLMAKFEKKGVRLIAFEEKIDCFASEG